mmetsp:Transcript_404/g.383  ORF Transcript_404/g.383 Transcript_404/m.383 type:complete len:128 (-) Transcript_404:53-436(-)
MFWLETFVGIVGSPRHTKSKAQITFLGRNYTLMGRHIKIPYNLGCFVDTRTTSSLNKSTARFLGFQQGVGFVPSKTRAGKSACVFCLCKMRKKQAIDMGVPARPTPLHASKFCLAGLALPLFYVPLA